MKTELITVVEKNGLDESKLKGLMSKFSTFFEQATEIEGAAKAIVVTDESQTEKMSEAREMRLKLKEIRINTEKTRKELKEQSLREGKAIDGISNIIKAVVVPAEEHLDKQEKFIENLEAEKKEKVHQQRIANLSEFVEDVSVYDLKDMSYEGFAKLMETSKAAVEAQKDAEKRAEEDRVSKEKADAEEREKMKADNERLRKESEAKDKAREEERQKEEAERFKVQNAKDKIEKELKAKKDAEKKEADEKAEKEKEAAMAPEKEKLIAFSNRIKSIEYPKDLSSEAQLIVNGAESALLEIAQLIVDKIKQL